MNPGSFACHCWAHVLCPPSFLPKWDVYFLLCWISEPKQLKISKYSMLHLGRKMTWLILPTTGYFSISGATSHRWTQATQQLGWSQQAAAPGDRQRRAAHSLSCTGGSLASKMVKNAFMSHRIVLVFFLVLEKWWPVCHLSMPVLHIWSVVTWLLLCLFSQELLRLGRALEVPDRCQQTALLGTKSGALVQPCKSDRCSERGELSYTLALYWYFLNSL